MSIYALVSQAQYISLTMPLCAIVLDY